MVLCTLSSKTKTKRRRSGSLIMDNITLWTYSLIAGGVVILIVATLLILIIVTARRIDYHANQVWETGKRIAANTVSIWMLEKTNAIAGQILTTAKGIAAAGVSIDKKLDGVAAILTRKG